MDCNEAGQLLPLSADGELDGRGELALAEHLSTCAECSAAQQKMAAGRAALAAATYHRAPPQLQQRVRMGLAGDATTVPAARPSWPRLGRRTALAIGGAGWAVAAALAVILVGVPPHGQIVAERADEQLIADHARAIVTGHLVDVASSDQHTVKPWLSSRLDYSPPVRDFAAQGFPLVGGRIDYLDRRVVAVLVYRRHLHLIDVFVEPEPGRPAARPTATAQGYGYNVLAWSGGGMSYRAVSDVERGELLSLQRLVEEE